MTKIEKRILILIFGFVVVITLNLFYVNHKIQEAGGIKAILISAGLEIKDIGRKIEATK